jgi:uncharacterized protein (TIGR03382 family)
VGAVAALSLAAAAHGTVLTFDPVPGNDALVLQAYGDRVASANQSGFQYGADLGFTPNVVVEYRPNMRYRTSGIGDLVNCLYREDSGNRILEINLTADLGYEVCLHYFDLAAQLGEALPVKSIQVTTGQLVVLYRQDWEVIPDIVEPRPLPVGQTGTPTHTRIEFDPAICNSPVVKIRIELDNLGVKVPRIGIDNIGFSQTPSPGTATLLVAAGGLVGFRRRRRTA